MKDTFQFIYGVFTVLFALLVGIYFAGFYPCHLHFHEQFQLFLCSADYAREVTGVPGGLADYLARFLTQGMRVPWLGGVVMAALLTAWMLLTQKGMEQKEGEPWRWAFGFVPALVALAAYCDEHVMPAAAVSILITLIADRGMACLNSAPLRQILALFVIPIIYMAAGPLALVFVILRIAAERRLWFAGLALLIGVLCTLLSQYVFPYPLSHLARGLHYYRYPAVFPTAAWVMAGATLAVILAGRWIPRLQSSPRRWTAVAGGTLVGLLTVGTAAAFCNTSREELLAYDYLTYRHDWNGILRKATQKQPDWSLSVTSLNLALAEAGQLGDYQFRFFQRSTEGMLPAFTREYLLPLTTAEVFYQLGMINTAQRYTFEAQEAIPDGQKSARCYQRLAETALINGDYPVARKYLNALKKTLFYRGWAQRRLDLIQDEEALTRHPEYGYLRRVKPSEDYLFSDQEMDSMLGRLFWGHKENRMAFEYLLGYCLLKKDLPRFYECYPLGKELGYTHIPRSYQEALLLMWTQQHDSYQGMPWSIDGTNAQRMVEFIRDYHAQRSAEYMKQRYGDTYWYYYAFE